MRAFSTEILAMGTSNKFDLNNPRDVSGYTEQDLFEIGNPFLFLGFPLHKPVYFLFQRKDCHQHVNGHEGTGL